MPAPGRSPDRRSALRTFLGRPTLGGWMTILNGVVCLAIVANFTLPIYADPPDVVFFVLVAVLLVLSFPLNLVPLLTRAKMESVPQEAVLACLLIVLNAILWGKVVDAILRRCFPSRFARAAAPAAPSPAGPAHPGR